MNKLPPPPSVPTPESDGASVRPCDKDDDERGTSDDDDDDDDDELTPGSRAAGSAHMGGMETVTRSPKPPMFPHDVPDIEPPIGTVAVFRSAFAGGGGSSTYMMLRTERGWSSDHCGRRDLRSWAELTDIDTMNAAILSRNPGSTARYVTVQVVIVAAPLAKGGVA